jgi:hypothetical protein
MENQMLRPRNWNLTLAVACLTAAVACGGATRRPSGSGGAGPDETGGTSGTGGGSGQGGVTSDGGASGGSGPAAGGSGEGGSGNGGAAGGGGQSNGGASGGGGAAGAGGESSGGASGDGGVAGGSGGGADEGGAGGSGGTTPPVTCTTDDDCASGGKCRGGVCMNAKACNDSTECGSADLVCDPSRGLCVDCAKAADCSDGQECVANQCVTPNKCESADDCEADQVCDESGTCVACAADDNCDSDQHCVQNTCRTACDTDKACTPDGMLCDTTLSVCVQCTAQKACATGTYCSSAGMCEPVVCVVGESMCSGDGVAECKADGSGWGEVSPCPESTPCKAYGGVAGCGGPSGDTDGGLPPEVDGGADGPIPSCTTATVDPCTSIPAFTGTQTVDGKDDDFCDVPSFVFDKAAATEHGIVNNYNGLQDSEFPSVKARVAWSSAGLHAFFDVTDAKVQSVTMADPEQALTSPYQGDSVELFISSNDTATGVPGGDSGAVSVTLAATGKSVSVTTTNTDGLSTTYAELSAAQYAQAETDGGYAIEVLLPWKDGSPGSGAKVRFDLALNIADDNFGSVSDMRDAQMVYYVGTVSDQTSCPGAAEPYCDDRTWCAPTLQ